MACMPVLGLAISRPDSRRSSSSKSAPPSSLGPPRPSPGAAPPAHSSAPAPSPAQPDSSPLQPQPLFSNLRGEARLSLCAVLRCARRGAGRTGLPEVAVQGLALHPAPERGPRGPGGFQPDWNLALGEFVAASRLPCSARRGPAQPGPWVNETWAASRQHRDAASAAAARRASRRPTSPRAPRTQSRSRRTPAELAADGPRGTRSASAPPPAARRLVCVLTRRCCCLCLCPLQPKASTKTAWFACTDAVS